MWGPKVAGGKGLLNFMGLDGGDGGEGGGSVAVASPALIYGLGSVLPY